MMPPYRPLKNAQSVRFVRLSRESKGGAIVAELEHFDLNSSTCPPYVAISYAWGPAIYERSVFLHGKEFAVRQNVYPMLELLCDHPDVRGNRWFWVDCICINQNDLRERGAQVVLMGHLFQQATSTIVWLGEATPASEGATEVLHSLSERDDSKKIKVLSAVSERQWNAVEDWVSRPWWSRFWTIQEFLIARDLVFFLGNDSIHRQTWRRSILALDRYRKRISAASFEQQWIRRRLLQHFNNGKTSRGLVALMAYVGRCQATDPRDRVYSLLGICNPLDREMVGDPTYQLDVREVYTLIVENFVRVHKSLDVVCFAPLFDGPKEDSGDEPAWPSWIPDWRRWSPHLCVPVRSMVSQPSRRHVGNFRSPHDLPKRVDVVYAASKETIPRITISTNRRRLTCRGVIVDLVDGLGSFWDLPGEDEQVVQSTSPFNIPEPLRAADRLADGAPRDDSSSSDVIEAIVRSLVLDRDGSYLTLPAPVERFRAEFQYIASEAINEPKKDAKHSFTKWFIANKHLRVRGLTLEQHHEAVPVPGTLPDATSNRFRCISEVTLSSRGRNRRFIVTDRGHVGVAPRKTRKGDVVCALYGCSVPLVLRRMGAGAPHTLIGECYLHGFMNGEALDCGAEMTDFVIE